MGTQRYGISIQMFNMISHVAQQMSEISTWTQEEKFRIPKQPCIILFTT